MRDRELNVNVRVMEEERAKLHALAVDRDLTASTLIRHWLREAYTARFGGSPPPGFAHGDVFDQSYRGYLSQAPIGESPAKPSRAARRATVKR